MTTINSGIKIMVLFNFQCKTCIASNLKKQNEERQMKKSSEESPKCTQFAWHEECEAWGRERPTTGTSIIFTLDRETGFVERLCFSQNRVEKNITYLKKEM